MSIIRTIKLCAIAIFALFACVFFVPKGSTQTKVQTAGERFKNIKVLNDMPADQLGKVMNIFSASLGVECSFCHVPNAFEKDDKPEKLTARKMIKMTFELDKDNFNNRPEVSCNTCHSGHEHPQSAPKLGAIAAENERPKQPDVKPTADQIVDKYIQAVGGTEKLSKITSRVVTAVRTESDNKTEPETITYHNGKYLLKTTYGDHWLADMYDGTTAYKFGKLQNMSLKPDEAEQIKREAEFFSPANIKTAYSKLDYRALDRVDGRDAYLLIGTSPSGIRERLYFDAQTGLLVRRSASTPTVLGNFVYQVDYLDYKNTGGIKMPMTIRYSMPNMGWTRKIVSVKNNAAVDDAVFTVPARS